MRKLYLTLFVTCTLFACSENDDSTNIEKLRADKIIFGSVSGMCIGGDCKDLYLIEDDKLFSDSNDESIKNSDWSNTTTFAVEDMGDENFEKVETLLNFPEKLLKSQENEDITVQMIGDFDYYLYIEKDGKSNELIFDHIHKDADAEIKSYFKTFLNSHQELGGHILDTIQINPGDHY